MNRPFFATLALLGTLSPHLCAAPAAQQETSREGMLVDHVYLVTLNVIPSAAVGSRSRPKLSVADLKVTDQGLPVKISYFSGPNGQNEPVLLWLVANCGGGRDGVSPTTGGSLIVGNDLQGLPKEYEVGVAHCGSDGKSEIDLLPASDRGAAQIVLNKVTQSGAVSASGGVDEEAVRDILQQIHTVGGPQKSAAPVVVVVFLAPNLMTSSNEAKRFARDVLSYSSPLVYAISTRAPLTSKGAKAPETNLIDSLAKETGGQRFSLASNQGRGALEEIVDGLHACYKVAWIPPPPYEGWHDLRVELTPGAIHRYGKIRMAYRSGYMSKFPGEPHKVSSNPVERITVEN